MTDSKLQDRTFLLLLIAVSIAFLAILWPYYEAVFWGVALAILFAPLHRRLLARMPQRRNLAALCTLLLCLVLVILPVTLLGIALVQEASHLYERIRSGQLNFGAYFQQVINAMPSWAMGWLDRMQLTSVSALQDKLSAVSVQASQLIATRALNIGQNTLQFVVSLGVMLYLLFFLLRDGRSLATRIRNAIPLKESQKTNLSSKFTTVIRATLKGNLMVAACQGLLGGLIFWTLGVQGPILWGVLMAFLSLLPAIGAGLIWAPVAIYFLATGALWQAAILTAFGVAVIGMVDNVLRPILVGRDTKMPDYVILISTLGGMTLLGLNGFVIGPVIAALFMACWDLFAPGDSL
ncbi:MAG: AI-2E family transporter [Giesbergeria sp.]|jgi:predicted PurR-regulated permease PerM|nr:AI-2E family transporter [Giesbergeria sp.]MBP6160516.1 AI-2E family transporter [Giesbergeria sp.]MBP7082750.1 AI-2E family transporter [Giesbergeria sp.]MBP9784642.1 AI-2E family transporter [Giesbergeria sp.]MBP9894207.1 AI-2E family transporter [Giesbergeria sp.]